MCDYHMVRILVSWKSAELTYHGPRETRSSSLGTQSRRYTRPSWRNKLRGATTRDERTHAPGRAPSPRYRRLFDSQLSRRAAISNEPKSCPDAAALSLRIIRAASGGCGNPFRTPTGGWSSPLQKGPCWMPGASIISTPPGQLRRRAPSSLYRRDVPLRRHSSASVPHRHD